MSKSKFTIHYEQIAQENLNLSVLNEKIMEKLLEAKKSNKPFIRIGSDEELEAEMLDPKTHYKGVPNFLDNIIGEEGYMNILSKLGKGREVSYGFGDKGGLKDNITSIGFVRIYHEMLSTIMDTIHPKKKVGFKFSADQEFNSALTKIYIKANEIVSVGVGLAESTGSYAASNLNDTVVKLVETFVLKSIVLIDKYMTIAYNNLEDKERESINYIKVFKDMKDSEDFTDLLNEFKTYTHLLVNYVYNLYHNAVQHNKSASYFLNALSKEEITDAFTLVENIEHKAVEMIYSKNVVKIFKLIVELLSTFDDVTVDSEAVVLNEEFVEKEEEDIDADSTL